MSNTSKKWYRTRPFKVVVVFFSFLFITFVLLAQMNFSSIIKADPVNITPIETKPYNVGMKITSSAFEDNTQIPPKYTCDGERISPPLSFFQVPSNAKSLALIMEDPDAPSGTFIHWVVYNIDANVRDVPENTIPEGGLPGQNNLGRVGYTPPCPPSGSHRYIFKLYALDIPSLNIKGTPTAAQLESAMNDHVIEQSQLIGIYR